MNVTADITDYDSRIAAGKAVEKQIIAALRKNGMEIADPSPHEDMHDKIDGWIVHEDVSRHSVQIKYRENGADVVFEVMKDLDANIIGRDSVSKAEYYLVVDPSGYGRLFLTAPIKKLANDILPLASSLKSAGKSSYKGHNWELKITTDRAHGNRKLMAYFNPAMFKSVKEWQNLI